MTPVLLLQEQVEALQTIKDDKRNIETVVNNLKEKSAQIQKKTTEMAYAIDRHYSLQSYNDAYNALFETNVDPNRRNFEEDEKLIKTVQRKNHLERFGIFRDAMGDSPDSSHTPKPSYGRSR